MSTWTDAQRDYARLISSADQDSRFLREQGLIPNVLELLGACTESTVLDAGTGTGWLFERTFPREAHAVDLVEPAQLPARVEFRKESVVSLTYPEDKFDAIVASMLLMFCEELTTVAKEFYRVAAPGGIIVISLTHPYFYRTGEVNADGTFALKRPLAEEDQFDIKIGETVGPLKYYYRPLPVYYNALLQANWQITETRDWFIESKDYSRFLKLGGRSKLFRSATIPLYTFIRATK